MGRGRRKLKDIDWDTKLESIREEFPEVDGIDWAKIFNERTNVFESIAGGVAKKFLIDKNEGLSSLYENKYSDLPFVEALDKLWGDRTVAEMSELTGITPNVIRRLKFGERPPMYEDMEKIAKAFGLDPGFFVEYRIAVVVSAIDRFLKSSPETCIVWYKKVRDRKGIEVR